MTFLGVLCKLYSCLNVKVLFLKFKFECSAYVFKLTISQYFYIKILNIKALQQTRSG